MAGFSLVGYWLTATCANLVTNFVLDAEYRLSSWKMVIVDCGGNTEDLQLILNLCFSLQQLLLCAILFEQPSPTSCSSTTLSSAEQNGVSQTFVNQYRCGNWLHAAFITVSHYVSWKLLILQVELIHLWPLPNPLQRSPSISGYKQISRSNLLTPSEVNLNLLILTRFKPLFVKR